VIADAIPTVVTAFGIGIALAGAPGPVQAVLLAEAVRGGMGRGARALVGASGTFGLLLGLLALGVSVAPQDGPLLRVLRIGGGAFLLWLAADSLRSGSAPRPERTDASTGPPPAVRGALAILLNPGAWLFIGAVASPLLATASRAGGTGAALVTATALLIGAGLGDIGVVILGATGLRRARPAIGRWINHGLVAALAALGVVFIAGGLVG
jgi:threonine/homoserine/homoserine lactone efflux protein